MKSTQMLRLIILLMFSAAIKAEVTIVMKGPWIAECDGEFISFHNRYDKALQSALNQMTDCNIIPPQRFEIRRSPVMKEDVNNDLLHSWDIPATKPYGSALAIIDRYDMREDFNLIGSCISEIQTDYISPSLAGVTLKI